MVMQWVGKALDGDMSEKAEHSLQLIRGNVFRWSVGEASARFYANLYTASIYRGEVWAGDGGASVAADPSG